MSSATLFPDLDHKRVERALNERLTLLSRHHEQVPDLVTKFEYTIKGSRDVDYTVTYDALDGGVLSCSCPDNEHRHKICKHLLFVLFRVFGFDSSEVNKLTLSDVLKKAETREKLWLERAKKAQAEGKSLEDENKVERRDFKNEDCPICYEKMEGEEDTTWCRESCGNSMHSGCLNEWLQRHSTCVLCRAKFKFSNRVGNNN